MNWRRLVLFISFGTSKAFTVDWDPFVILAPVDTEESAKFIKNLPINVYFDVAKGSYITGVFGEKLKSVAPDLVAKFDKKISLGGRTEIVSTEIVDQNVLFLHALSALKKLDKISDSLKSKLHHVVMSTELDKYGGFGTLAKSIKPSVRLLARMNISNMQLEIIENQFNALNSTSHVRDDIRKKLLNAKMERLRGDNERYFSQLQEHFATVQKIHQNRTEQLFNIGREEDDAKNKFELRVLEEEIKEQLQLIEMERSLSSAIIQFRKEQELIYLAKKEVLDRKLLDTRAEATKNQVAAFLDVVVGQAHEFALGVFGNTRQFFIRGFGAIALLTGLLVLMELVASFKYLLSVKRKKNKRCILPLPRQAHRAEHYPFDADVERSLDRLKACYDAAAEECTLPLPNALLYGAPGCGKTLHILRMLQFISINSFVVSSGDLLAHGAGAGLVLRQFTERHRQGSPEKCILVIEEADAILATRKPLVSVGTACRQHISDAASPHRLCLYSILEAIRESSPSFSVILVTRLSLQEIDQAILDRMDHLVHFPLPSLAQRCEYIRRHMVEKFLDILSPADRERLRTLDALPSEDPETDTPVPSSSESGEFHVAADVLSMVQRSQGWSYRQLSKFLNTIHYRAHATATCRLDSALWSQEMKNHTEQQQGDYL